MAFVRLRGPRVQELKSSGGVLYSVQSTLPVAGGQSPGRVLGVTPWGPLAAAFAVAWAEHENSCGLAGHRLPRRVRSPCFRWPPKSMFDFSAPFRSLLGSIPSSFHPFVLPFLPTSMYRFFPSSFHTFFPSSLDPFIHFSLRPCTHSSILPFILSSIGPFILSCLLPSTFHRSSPSSLHPFFPSSLGAFNPGPAACAKRLNNIFGIFWDVKIFIQGPSRASNYT